MQASAPPLAVPVRRLRATLRAVLRAVQEGGDRVVLTRHGRPVAALVPVGALDALNLLGQVLPGAAEVAAGLSAPVAGGDETSGEPAGNRPREVSVPSPLAVVALTSRPPGRSVPPGARP